MRVIRHLRAQPTRSPRVVLTLGNFDGVHLGHRAIVRRAVEQARRIGGQATALTFHPHPVAVIAPDRAAPLIQPVSDRLRTMRSLGIDATILQRFTPAFSRLEPAAFVEELLLPKLDLAHVVVGYNVTFGHRRAGTADTLRALGERLGFAVEVVGPVTAGEERVSSSAVRRLVGAGDVARAAALLGRPFTVRGRVIMGEQRGRTLGFPTANLHLRDRLLLPADGVYAVRVTVDDAGEELPGVLNLGIRPTFGERRRTFEVFLLDFAGDLYGRWLRVHLIERLRGERAFAGPEALRAAIAADVARAREVLAPSRGR